MVDFPVGDSATYGFHGGDFENDTEGMKKFGGTVCVGVLLPYR